MKTSNDPKKKLDKERAEDAEKRAERRKDKIVNTVLFLFAFSVGAVCTILVILVQRY